MADDTRPVTWLTRYEEVRSAFKNAGLLQASYDGAKDTVFADVLVTLDGVEHGRRRRAEATLFRLQVVSELERVVVPAMAQRLVGSFARTGAADLVDVSRLVSTALAARVVGLDDCDEIERLDELSQLMATLHEGAVIDWATRPREQVLARVRDARDRYAERYFEPALAARRRAAARPSARARDLLELLVDDSQALDMDAAKMLRESVHYLVATGHTASTVLVHAMDEIWRWLDAHPGERSLIADAEFVRACVSEAMRLWPPSGWQFRVAAHDLTLDSGRAVRRGERLGLNLIEANRDPDVFGDDAAAFDPRRPLPRGIAGYGLAFGDGAHVCIGKRLAAGSADTPGAQGVVTSIAMALFEAGCVPDPARPPQLQPGTARHQYRCYPVCFGA